MKSAKECKINQLLRLAELCDTTQAEKRKYYMELVESLILDNETLFDFTSEKHFVPPEYKHLIEFYEQYKDLLIGNSSESNYQHYLAFCGEKNIKPLERLPFSQRMCNYFPLKTAVKRNKNVILRIWVVRE